MKLLGSLRRLAKYVDLHEHDDQDQADLRMAACEISSVCKLCSSDIQALRICAKFIEKDVNKQSLKQRGSQKDALIMSRINLQFQRSDRIILNEPWNGRMHNYVVGHGMGDGGGKNQLAKHSHEAMALIGHNSCNGILTTIYCYQTKIAEWRRQLDDAACAQPTLRPKREIDRYLTGTCLRHLRLNSATRPMQISAVRHSEAMGMYGCSSIIYQGSSSDVLQVRAWASVRIRVRVRVMCGHAARGIVVIRCERELLI
ncbi:hypothetical protein Tco_0811535 [Tanacetum coccineum]